MNDFVFPIKKLANFYHYYANEYKKNQNQDLTIMGNQTINKKLADITQKLFEDNKIELLGPLDVKYFIYQYIRQYLIQYPNCENINVKVNDSGYSNSNWKTVTLALNKGDIEDPNNFKKSKLEVVHINALKSGLNQLNKLYSDNKFTFELVVKIKNNTHFKESSKNLPIKLKYIEIAVDDKTDPSEITFKGEYVGSHSRFIQRMNDDLYTIISILEFSDAIRVKEHLHRDKFKSKTIYLGETGELKISFSLPSENEIELINLPNKWSEVLEDFVSNNLFVLDTKLLNILDRKPGRSVLRFVLGFFNTEVSRHSSYDYLKYWQAVEVMLGSPANKIEKTLKNKATSCLEGTQRINEYDQLRQIRHDIVHRGLPKVSGSDLFMMRDFAKLLFYKLLETKTL